ncbi:MAG: hypothetical protein ABEN55_00420 [Bradymonadaceae bacterium]
MRNKTTVEIVDKRTDETRTLTNDNSFGYVQAYEILRAAETAKQTRDVDEAAERLKSGRLNWNGGARADETWTIEIRNVRVPGGERVPRVKVGQYKLGLLSVEEFEVRCSEFRADKRG